MSDVDYRETMRSQIEAMPAWRFVCERDWSYGPHCYALGVLWDRNFEAEPGEFIYRKRVLLRLTFRLRFERWH